MCEIPYLRYLWLGGQYTAIVRLVYTVTQYIKRVYVSNVEHILLGMLGIQKKNVSTKLFSRGKIYISWEQSWCKSYKKAHSSNKFVWLRTSSFNNKGDKVRYEFYSMAL